MRLHQEGRIGNDVGKQRERTRGWRKRVKAGAAAGRPSCRRLRERLRKGCGSDFFYSAAVRRELRNRSRSYGESSRGGPPRLTHRMTLSCYVTVSSPYKRKRTRHLLTFSTSSVASTTNTSSHSPFRHIIRVLTFSATLIFPQSWIRLPRE